jgi:Putative adhesin
MTGSTDRSDLDLTGITAVEVATFGGELSVVTGTDRPRLEATVHGNASWSVERVGKLLYIVGRKRGFFYMGSGVSLRLWLPETLTLKLANVSADIRVRGDVRSLTAKCTSGGIEVRASNLTEAKLRAVSGRVSVHGVTGKIEIEAWPGNVRVVNSGGELHITTAPGNVLLEQVVLSPSGSHWVSASPGDIEVVGIQAPSGLDLHGTSTQPPIRAELPSDTVRNKGRNLHVRRPGPNPAKLQLNAVGRLSVRG